MTLEGIGTMAVTVKFVGVLRNIAGKSKLDFELQDISLRNALEKIVDELPKLREAVADPKTNMLVLVNGKEISVLNGLETKLKRGDEVVLVPVLHGG